MLIQNRNIIYIWFFMLWILSFLDAWFTSIGLRMGVIGESNPLMEMAYDQSHALVYLIKCVLPILFLYFWIKEPKRWMIPTLIILQFLYLGILIIHGIWAWHL